MKCVESTLAQLKQIPLRQARNEAIRLIDQKDYEFSVPSVDNSYPTAGSPAFSSWGKQTTLKSYINLSDEIYRAAQSILDTVELEQPVRLLGVSLSNLKHQAEQLPLFENERKKLFATQAMDSINERFGAMAVTYGSLLPGKKKCGQPCNPA